MTDRLLLESAPTQARSLEGRPLAMYSSLMLADRSRLRLLESWPRFAAAFGEQRRPMSGLNERRERMTWIEQEHGMDCGARKRS